MTELEYNKAVCAILGAAGVTHEVKLIGDSCPPFCKDRGKLGIGVFPRKTHVHGQHFQLTLARLTAGTVAVIDFWNSYADTEAFKRPRLGGKMYFPLRRQPYPTAVGVLSTCDLIQPDTFEEWCYNGCYDSDSRKMYACWEKCNENFRALRNVLGVDNLNKISEALEGY